MTSGEMKLLPCPFCGEKKVKITERYHIGFGIFCPKCHNTILKYYENTDELILQWNTRPSLAVAWPEKLTYFHSKKGYPDNCVEAANLMRDKCIAAFDAAMRRVDGT